MSDTAGEKLGKSGSFHERNSFDEGAPTSMEPVFSTAAGVRIDVKQESIDKSKKLLNSDLNASTSTKAFSSPLITRTKGNNAFVSPFRRDDQSTSSVKKRQATSGIRDYEAPPPKKLLIDEVPDERHKSKNKKSKKDKRKKSKKRSHKKDIIEMNADVMKRSRVYEKNQVRIVLQESEKSQLVLAKAEFECGKTIRFGDKVRVRAEVLKRDKSNTVTEVFIDKVLENKENGARPHITRHSIAATPFCIKPKFIHELSDQEIKMTTLQVNILDLNLEVYEGCERCNHQVPSTTSTDRGDCKNCKDLKTQTRAMVYSRMRVMDFSGQIFVNVKTKTMEKFLDIFGYEGVDQWLQFKEPQERTNYVFQPIMIQVEKTSSNEWECTDVAEVDWIVYNAYLKGKEQRLRKKEKKGLKEMKRKERKERKQSQKKKKE